MPDKDTTLPGTTAIGDADVTFMPPTRVSDTPLPAVNYLLFFRKSLS